MIILGKRSLEYRDYWFSSGTEGSYGPVETSLQYDAASSTPAENEVLESGHCPKCNDKLAGDSGMFCARDQIEWEQGEAS